MTDTPTTPPSDELRHDIAELPHDEIVGYLTTYSQQSADQQSSRLGEIANLAISGHITTQTYRQIHAQVTGRPSSPSAGNPDADSTPLPTPRPLSDQETVALQQLARDLGGPLLRRAADELEMLRAAIRNIAAVEPVQPLGADATTCTYCDAISNNGPLQHSDDCTWHDTRRWALAAAQPTPKEPQP